MVKEDKLIPYKRIKRIIGKNVNGEVVSKEAVEYLQTLLESQLKLICDNVVIQHKEMNRLRKYHGLREKRRIQVSDFLNLSGTKINPDLFFSHEGEVGSHNGNTTLSDKANIEVA
jgi:hypothetical protein